MWIPFNLSYNKNARVVLEHGYRVSRWRHGKPLTISLSLLKLYLSLCPSVMKRPGAHFHAAIRTQIRRTSLQSLRTRDRPKIRVVAQGVIITSARSDCYRVLGRTVEALPLSLPSGARTAYRPTQHKRARLTM